MQYKIWMKSFIILLLLFFYTLLQFNKGFIAIDNHVFPNGWLALIYLIIFGMIIIVFATIPTKD